jgi:predicted HTH transcriptional regulator
MDLFVDDLQQITFSDVESFLAISSPEDQRPTEGTRIDFKKAVPNDLCDTVAAFANTFGGLIFIGVESAKRGNNIPTKIAGTLFPGGDVRASLTNKITSQVLPRPDISIGVAPMPGGSGSVVAVIRVREGVFPPYQFTSGDKVRFPIRVIDTNKMATLRDIEQMFKNREAFSESPESRVEGFSTNFLFPAFDDTRSLTS